MSVKIFPSFVRTGVFPDLYISLNARPRSGFDLPLFLADDLTPRIASCIAKVFSFPFNLESFATCAILLVAAGLLGFVFGLRPRSSTWLRLRFWLNFWFRLRFWLRLRFFNYLFDNFFLDHYLCALRLFINSSFERRVTLLPVLSFKKPDFLVLINLSSKFANFFFFFGPD
jgi:hypothetical protein